MLPAGVKPPLDCGACNLCCQLLAVPDIHKPACVWCEHAGRPHGGCNLHGQPDYPAACASFHCLWLVSQSHAPATRWILGLRPDRSGVVFHDARDPDDPDTLYIHIDPEKPDAWQWEPVKAEIEMVLAGGGSVHVIIGLRRVVLEPDAAPQYRDDGSAATTMLRQVQ